MTSAPLFPRRCGSRAFLGLLLLTAAASLRAAPVPHPDRPDRLVETRNGFSVEYSPGQEAWMEMAFAQLQAIAQAAAEPAPAAATGSPPTGPATPGSARDLRARRNEILAAIARQTGLPHATELQGRVFDTFLGYYEMLTTTVEELSRDLPDMFIVHRMAIWQRDDLVGRLRAGAKIEGMSYDPATDRGSVDLKFPNIQMSPAFVSRLKEIQAAINAQRIKHRYALDRGSFSASVSLAPPSLPLPPAAAPTASPPADPAADLVIPVIYRGDRASPPSPEAFALLPQSLSSAQAALKQLATAYRDANQICIILHETAESGLMENLIGSRDRRWLCDGTANYVAWRVARDLWGPAFATQVYALDAQLRQFAAQQSAIHLAAWSAVEAQSKEETETPLDHAHYAFATRAIFLLTERHGADALSLLWSDVAHTPRAKVSAKTFANAYHRRFKGDLAALIRDAEQLPLPAPPPSPPPRA